MFFGYLHDLFYRHASVYRAMTIEEYRQGIMYQQFAFKEFDHICQHWNRASQKVDMRAMAYTAELYDYILHLPRYNVARSGWEFHPRTEETVVYMTALAK
jgi:hypothetical protein